jgi:hypothetical protein
VGGAPAARAPRGPGAAPGLDLAAIKRELREVLEALRA